MVTQQRSQGLPQPRQTVATSAGSPSAVPEWMTEAWKHRVEAEARHRLKREIRGVSTRR